jgi:(p)ppGpp synthase/HD superfamily hydrolase
MDLSIDNVRKAWELAADAHKGQQYSGPEEGEKREYLSHIGAVVLELMYAIPEDEIMDQELAILCAILHDTLEDTGTNYEEIEESFGKKVAEGVLALSKNPEIEGKRAQLKDSLDRIQKQSREIGMVKMADRIVNLSPPPFNWNTKKRKSYLEESKMIYDALKDCSVLLAGRLAEKMLNYSSYIF